MYTPAYSANLKRSVENWYGKMPPTSTDADDGAFGDESLPEGGLELLDRVGLKILVMIDEGP